MGYTDDQLVLYDDSAYKRAQYFADRAELPVCVSVSIGNVLGSLRRSGSTPLPHRDFMARAASVLFAE